MEEEIKVVETESDIAEKDVKVQVEELLASANLTKAELKDVAKAVGVYLEAIAKEEFAEFITNAKQYLGKIESYLGRPLLYGVVVYLLLSKLGVI